MKKSTKPVFLYLPFHFAAAAFTWYDIDHRPAERIRGRKRVWKIASPVNTLGTVGYWLFGRT
ncbi:MAG: hypothetical protein EPN30_04560 [Actinomycetota bacterium]|nr:MAG: hypothetical protein EPN30_04560 [Actinomycetota bacterium]